MAEMTTSDHIAILFPAHPTLEQPTPRELAGMKPEKVRQLSQVWKDSIAAAAHDPLRSGDHPPHWRDAIEELERAETDTLLVSGGNRSSKTEFGAYVAVRALLENPGTELFCWSQTKDTSVIIQQPRVLKMLPPEYRKRREDDACSIHYKIASGFVNNRFTLPNGSACYFWTYSQYILNANMIEGLEIGWKGRFGEVAPFLGRGGLANWFDEYLIEPSLYRTIDERMSTRDAKGITTYTPIHQYTETVEEMLDGMETVIEERTLPEDPPQIRDQAVPYIQRNGSRSAIYFATHKNRYHNYERSKRNMAGKPRDWVLMKLYGVPTKVTSSKFPSFSKEIHVIEELPRLVTGEKTEVEYQPTRYHIAIPAGDRPWFMIWVAVAEDGRHFVYREWPRFDEDGAFAERREGEWDWGDACKGDCCGMGSRAYKRIIEELEDGEEIAERIMFSGMETVADEMSDIEIVFNELDDEGEQEGFQSIHTLLEQPELFILEHCRNVTGGIVGYDVDKQRTDRAHPWKPVIDALRLMAQAQLTYDPEPAEPQRAWGGY